ncbi:MAG TPA: ABC transporter ATP-binding protein [Micromonosporaceae bacterium]|nr:ABC transporter ATP-binding protein [Micromonosporaceae bacterium]
MEERPTGSGSMRRMPRLCWTAVCLVWAAGRREFLASLVLRVLTGGLLGAILLLGGGMLASVLAADRGTAGLGEAVPRVVPLMLAIALSAVFGAVSRELHTILGGLVERYTQEQVVAVTAAVELEVFEAPIFHDRLLRAATGGQQRPTQIVEGLLGLVGAVVGIVGTSVALLALQPWLVPVTIVAAVPLLVAVTRGGEILFGFSWSVTAMERERAYLYHLLTTKEPAKEVRAFGLGSFLRARHAQLHADYLADLRRTAWRRLWVSLRGTVLMLLVLGAAITGLLWLSVSGRMDLAVAGVALAATVVFAERLTNGVMSAGRLYEAARFIEDFTSFVALKAVVEARRARRAAPAGFSTLRVEGVSFTYPAGHQPALRDVTMEIVRGQVVALVGENGSGKTTLAKLLCRLYRPQLGRILWDGVDIADVDADGLRDSVAVIFQDFVRYALTARTNIGVGRHIRLDDETSVLTAAKHAGADQFLAALPAGYDTILSAEYEGGKDLSVGQWQRVALARAFFRDAPFIILDEPTAALDARAEHDLFEAIRSLCHGRSVLLVSHRFSSVRSADHIYVLDAGRIIEHGTHDELMTSAGRYAELFTLQASAYLAQGDGPRPDRSNGNGAQSSGSGPAYFGLRQDPASQ